MNENVHSPSHRRLTGHFERAVVAGKVVSAFVPLPLPPRAPALRLDVDRLRAADAAIDRLSVVCDVIGPFAHGFVCAEAVMSAQIDGSQATLIDVFNRDASSDDAAAGADVDAVRNAVDALAHVRAALAAHHTQPTLRLLHETHALLRRGDLHAGQLRRTQSSTATFVPPPPHLVPALLADLVRFLHFDDGGDGHDDALPPLVRIALAHAQFSIIQPYLDGNGCMGRLLTSLLFEHFGPLSQPLLQLSMHFKLCRGAYERRLADVRRHGDFEGFVDFFLDGVRIAADQGVRTATKLLALVDEQRTRLLADDDASVTALRLFELLPRRPIVTIPMAAEWLSTSRPTVTRAIQTLVTCGILEETSGKQRDRRWAWRRALDILRLGTDL